MLFDRLCGREIGISWPSFRAWWDATERAPLSQDARESLANVVAFFKVSGEGIWRGEWICGWRHKTTFYACISDARASRREICYAGSHGGDSRRNCGGQVSNEC